MLSDAASGAALAMNFKNMHERIGIDPVPEAMLFLDRPIDEEENSEEFGKTTFHFVT